ncbi:MAG: hypothetical protein KGZ85_15195 [Ignavibacterium sp.]|nr:hypothetical protein [Ignavibacterium sp.]
MSKTLYIWDLANTLFLEEWNKNTGFENYDQYVESLGYDLKKISPLDYERAYEKPYRFGLYKIKIADGFEEVLSWTKNNEVFTSGLQGSIGWRAEYFLKQGFFNVEPYFQKIYSTFDFGNSNKKTKEMLIKILNEKVKEGYNQVVYTDDKLENCLFFLEAAKEITNLKVKIYNIKNDDLGIRKKDNYWEIGNLHNLMENEKKVKL